MSRSAADATRFTSTTPHASAKFHPSAVKANSAPPRKPGPPGETPQEKVRRLRAAADAARNAQVSTLDKLILRGRVWADKAHRFTALSLIGATFIAGGITVYALTDMMIYNRRKRAEFFAEQKAQYDAAIHTAKEALASGTATEAQINFLNMDNAEKARVEALKAEKEQKKGIFKKGSEWLFSGLKKEEGADDAAISQATLGVEAPKEAADSLVKVEGEVMKAIDEKKMTIADKAKQAFENEKERQRTGGPLDRIGVSTDDSKSGEESPKSGGWFSFITRRS